MQRRNVDSCVDLFNLVSFADDAKWHHTLLLSLHQVIAFCLTAPSHYRQAHCHLVLYKQLKYFFYQNTTFAMYENVFENASCKILAICASHSVLCMSL